jgi:eukaryotic-like serine/threonine-protein kinase
MGQPNEWERLQGALDEHGETMQAQTLDKDSTRILPAFGDSLPHAVRSGADEQDGVGSLRQVGRYQIGERIGRGAMATVYKGYDPDIGRPLALKFLHAQLCVDEEYRGRFVREARAAGGLSHSNIVTVFDTGEIQGRPYIAMELIEGTPLSEIMRPGESLPIRDVCDIGAQLARALDYAHGKGIFHRDIKPSNIIRVKDSNTVKVTDFGIAHMHDAQQTRKGSVLGTPQYMSPEQAMGLKVDGRSDLFSVGVVLYQLLTGQAPFEASSLVTLAHRIAKEEPKPIDELRRDVPAALRRVVERCLRKTPDKRYASGAELAQALGKVIAEIDEEGVEAGKPRIIPLRIKWTLFMALVVALTMAVTAAVVKQRQYDAMMGQATEYGASLAKFLAAEVSVAVLEEDWVTIEVLVRDIMETQRFHHISVLDAKAVVQVSSDADALGKRVSARPGEEQIDARPDRVVVRRYLRADGAAILEFDAPITFLNGDKRIDLGRVHLGVPEEPLARVARLSLGWMAFLALITVAAVTLATYIMAQRYSRPLRLLQESMEEIARGRLDYRINEKRNDEFGEAYRAFDSMAQALQRRAEPEETRPGS